MREELLRWLFTVAQTDPGISDAQRPALERYRRAMGAPPATTTTSPAPVEVFDLGRIPLSDRIDVLCLLLRGADAGENAECALVRRLSGLLGIPLPRFEELWEQHAARQRRRRRRGLVAGLIAAMLVVAVVAAVFEMVRRGRTSGPEVEALLAAAREQVERIESLRADSAENLRTSTRRPLDEEIDELLAPIKRDLQTQIVALTDRDPPSSEEIERLAEMVSQNREQLARIIEQFRDRAGTFRGYVQRYGPSVLLVMVQSFLVRAGDEEEVTGFGTGFFVSKDGVIVTNRHVVRPWEARPDLLAAGYRLDPSRVRIAAWPTGSRVADGENRPVLDDAYFTGRRTLSLALEGSGDTDLALLRATVAQPVLPLPLSDRDPGSIQVFEAVSVLGYPSGSEILERGHAVMAPSTGSVRKVEESIFLEGSILPGNSGGPVIDLDGYVIAIATRNNVDSSMGIGIPSREILTLLEQLNSPSRP